MSSWTTGPPTWTAKSGLGRTAEKVQHGTEPIPPVLELQPVAGVIGISYLGAEIPDNRVEDFSEELDVAVVKLESHHGVILSSRLREQTAAPDPGR